MSPTISQKHSYLDPIWLCKSSNLLLSFWPNSNNYTQSTIYLHLMTNVRTLAKSISLAGCYMQLPFTQLHLSIYNLVHPDSQQQNLQAHASSALSGLCQRALGQVILGHHSGPRRSSASRIRNHPLKSPLKLVLLTHTYTYPHYRWKYEKWMASRKYADRCQNCRTTGLSLYQKKGHQDCDQEVGNTFF